ncbi:MAG: glycosyltransferase family 2 protein [Microgenomates group bacterium]
MTVSIIIPCYNEERRIIPIISRIKKSKIVDEIVVVDDGSQSQTKKILSKIAGINLITHTKNHGKSQAMKTGFLQSTGDIVAFIDADLRNFQTKNITDLVTPIINNQCDITLSDRTGDLYLFQAFSAAYTGERAIKRELLQKHLQIFKARGFLIEGAFNKVFFKPNYRLLRVYFPKVRSYAKFLKDGVAGQINDLKMVSDMIKYFGLAEMTRQITFAVNLPHFQKK